jgi:hypothetical protein
MHDHVQIGLQSLRCSVSSTVCDASRPQHTQTTTSSRMHCDCAASFASCAFAARAQLCTTSLTIMMSRSCQMECHAQSADTITVHQATPRHDHLRLLCLSAVAICHAAAGNRIPSQCCSSTAAPSAPPPALQNHTLALLSIGRYQLHREGNVSENAMQQHITHSPTPHAWLQARAAVID